MSETTRHPDINVFDLLVLSRIPNIGSGRMRALVTAAGSADISNLTARDIASIEGFQRKLAVQVVHFYKSEECEEAKRFAERQLSRANKLEASIISFWEKSYPELLRKIYDPPAYLFALGEFAPTDKFGIAIVGTRTPTPYGKAVTETLSAELTRIGVTVMSGLARGIDSLAHHAALKASGRTIAVMGSGLDVMYPPENRALAERIVSNGVVLTENDMGAKPDAVNFPKRNRIVSGMSLGTLVVETALNGGAMITANIALDQNREVFAVPGDIRTKQSQGCHALIRSGRAKLVESVEDIVAELEPKLRPLMPQAAKAHKPPPSLTLFEKKVYDVLTDQPVHVDLIAELAGISTSEVLVHLLGLEFKNGVKQMAGKMFVKI